MKRYHGRFTACIQSHGTSFRRESRDGSGPVSEYHSLGLYFVSKRLFLPVLLAALSCFAVSFERQSLVLPTDMANGKENPVVRTGDVDGDGLDDILVGRGRMVALIIQSPGKGVAESAPCAMELPGETLWYTLAPTGGTARDLVYADGEGIWRRRIENRSWAAPERIHSQSGLPSAPAAAIRVLDTRELSWCPADALPVISDSRLLLAHPDGTNEDVALKAKETCRLDAAADTRWSLNGGTGPFTLLRETWAEVKNGEKHPVLMERRQLTVLLSRYKESHGRTFHSFEDLGSGSKADLVIYSYRWGMDPKTLLIMFLRQPDGTYHDEPDRVLRLRGIPVEWDHSQSAGFRSPFVDVTGDGREDLLFTEIETHALSAQNILRAFADAAIRWQLTIRTGTPEHVFSERPARSIPVAGLPPFFDEDGRMVRLEGDFNGDGHVDLFVRRDLLTVTVHLGHPDSDIFSETPDFSFGVPYQGAKILCDLNGDHCTDLLLSDHKSGEVSLYLSRP